MRVPDLWVRGFKLCQFMIVSRKEKIAGFKRNQMLKQSLSQTHTIKGACSTTDLIQNHKTLGSHTLYDFSSLFHFDHESRKTFRQRVIGPDTRKDTIEQRHRRFTCRYKTTRLSKDSGQGHLAH